MTLFTPAKSDPIVGSTTLYADGKWGLVAVATKEWIQVLTRDGRNVLRFKNVHSNDDYGLALVGKLPNAERFVFQFKASYYLPRDRRALIPELFQVVSADGTVVPEIELPLLALPEIFQSPLDSAVGSIVPPVLIAPLRVAIRNSGQSFPPIILLVSVAVGLLSAAGGVMVSRRFAFSWRRTVGWALFNGLLGVPGLLTFLSVHEWPLRESCASCGKLRVVIREDCEHCGADFPPPDRDGTEIFEPVQGLGDLGKRV